MKKVFLSFLLLSFFSLYAADEDEENNSLIIPPDSTELAAAEHLGPEADGFAAVGDFGPREDDDFVDPRVLRDFIESRGLIECRQKCGKLILAGDVRAKWVTVGEEVNGIKKRGSGTDIANNRFKSEINIFLDYETPCSWVSTKLRWTNFDGVDGGTATKTDMDRAFIGYDVFTRGKEDFYIEIGRSNLGYVFDSRVQFGSVFDGIHFYYTNCFPGFGTVVLHGGPFIVDSFNNHYAWIVEGFVTQWWDTGWTFKWSVIDWERHAPTAYIGNGDFDGTIIDNPRYRFLVAQMLFGYQKDVDFWGCKTLFLYGAVLRNYDAKRSFATDNRLLNSAWYAGFTLGKLCKACDWSLDINYQFVQAQAIPEFDLSGIGHGNADDVLFSDAVFFGFSPSLARGFNNYKGWQFTLMYAVTDTLSIKSIAQWSSPANSSIGGDFFYKNFEMAVIYAF